MMLRDVDAGWEEAQVSEMADESMVVGRSAIKGILSAGPPRTRDPSVNTRYRLRIGISILQVNR
jgi:hypothetical protein